MWVRYGQGLSMQWIRLIAFVFLMYASGARPGELESLQWNHILLMDASTKPIQILNQENYDKLRVSAYYFQLWFQQKQSPVNKVNSIVPCGSAPAKWLHGLAKLAFFSHSPAHFKTFLFPNLDGNSKSFVHYSAMNQDWKTMKTLAFQFGILEEEKCLEATLYSVKRGLVTDMLAADVPLAVSMSVTRHKYVSSHLCYLVQDDKKVQKQAIAYKKDRL